MSRLTVNLAMWAQQHGHRRLYWCITLWWQIRNWWLAKVWDERVYRWLRWVGRPFRRRCALHHMELVRGMCLICSLHQQAKIASLRPR